MMKILGLTWVIEDDMIGLNKQKQSHHARSNSTTVLKQISSVYDLLGLLSTVTLQGKIFLQALWNKKLPWDEPLPVQEELQWLKIDTHLREISDCYIPRHIGLDRADKPKCQLLILCDASKYAYAATVYLHQKAGDRCINSLIFSKARLAPDTIY